MRFQPCSFGHYVYTARDNKQLRFVVYDIPRADDDEDDTLQEIQEARQKGGGDFTLYYSSKSNLILLSLFFSPEKLSRHSL